MKHQREKKEFGRDAQQRKALWKTMLGSLILHEKIKTTEAKAKELKQRIDRVVNIAKKSKTASQKASVARELIKHLPAAAAKKIMGEFLNNFEKRISGFSRVIKLAPRKSDGAKVAVIELVK